MSQQSTPIQALEQQRLLLQLEYQTEKEAFRQQTETIGMERKVKRGEAWWPVKVCKSYYNSLNQLAVEVVRTGDTDIEHNFEFGRPVQFFYGANEANKPNGPNGAIRYFRQTGGLLPADRKTGSARQGHTWQRPSGLSARPLLFKETGRQGYRETRRDEG